MMNDEEILMHFGPALNAMSVGERASFGRLAAFVHELGLDWWQTGINSEVARFGRNESREDDAQFVLGIVRGRGALTISINGSKRTEGVTPYQREPLTVNLLDQIASELKASQNGWPDRLTLKEPRSGNWPKAALPSKPEDLLILIDCFVERVDESLALSSEERQKRLISAVKKPTIVAVTTNVYDRNPDVVAEVLYQAKGLCGVCEKEAPFLRKKDGSPYLEVHHKIPLSENGDDTVDNAIAVCPNCHKQCHYGANAALFS